ncbi:MAG: hypothetical protein CME19_18355 [Gemmatimonadetes bacterium]|nr:hypothetical protein [Gemmatimonadota bacterium]
MINAEVLGVVTARGGSKSVPRKNILPLLGKPLICYTLDTARASRSLGRLVVSTDDEEIKSISQAAGVDVIDRPEVYAKDTSRTEEALIHAIDVLAQTESYEPDVVVTLEPTSPLRSVGLIDRCVRELVESEADAVVSVVDTNALVGRIVEGRFEYLIPNQPRRRQEREPLYVESSTVYATNAKKLRETRSVLGTRLHAVVAEPEEALDINTPLDFVIVESVMKWHSQKDGGYEH